MRAVTWILSCLSLVALSQCSQIVLSNEVEKADDVKCEIGSLSGVRVKANGDILQMQAEGDLYNWKLGYDSRGASTNKHLEIDVITSCSDTYCRALFKQVSSSGGYYLYMSSNGYIYETSSTSSDDRYFDYSYNSNYGRCVWSNRVTGRYLTRTGVSDTGGFYVVGGSSGPVLDLKFI